MSSAADLTVAERKARLIANAESKGFRVAEDWELQTLPWEDLYHAMHKGEQVGPVFVRAERSNHA